jgi:VWFA-related protein
MRFFRLLLLTAVISVSLFSQEKAPEIAQSGTVIRSNPRLVLVNIVATDSSGRPVHGLKQRDFTVLEDGKTQSLRAFEEHRTNTNDASMPPSLNLGPNVHTNFVPVPKDSVTNILLFDVINMSSQDLVSAKAELLKTVENLPPGQQFALFVLGSRLRMIQGFTWDKDAMITAAKGVNTNTNPVYSDARTFSTQMGEIRETAIIKNARSYQALVTSLAEEQEIKLGSRELFTFDGLYQLARAVVAIPGRKNLIWITSGFPFDPTNGDMERFTRLTSQLAASQVAVYPIDARGVIVAQPDGATRDSEIFSPSGGGAISGWLSGQSEEIRSTYQTMLDIASQTGGRAFLNQNTFLPAINHIVEAGSNYYLTAYRPSNNHWDGHFRKIQVKTSRPGVRLLYRTGYYAIEDPSTLPQAQDRDRALQIAMQPGTPSSTTLIFKTRVVPPPDGAKPVQLDFLVDVADLAVVEEHSTPRKTNVDVMFVASAFDLQGHIAQSRSWSVKSGFSDSDLHAMLQRGLQIHQDFALGPGNYQLRLGVLDRNSGKVGTLDVPINIVSTSAVK